MCSHGLLGFITDFNDFLTLRISRTPPNMRVTQCATLKMFKAIQQWCVFYDLVTRWHVVWGNLVVKLLLTKIMDLFNYIEYYILIYLQ